MRDPNEVFERVKQKVTHHKKRKMHRVCTILAVSIPITVIIIALGIRMWFGASKGKLQDSEGKTSIAHVTTPGVTVTSTPGGEYAKKEDEITPYPTYEPTKVWTYTEAIDFVRSNAQKNQNAALFTIPTLSYYDVALMSIYRRFDVWETSGSMPYGITSMLASVVNPGIRKMSDDMYYLVFDTETNIRTYLFLSEQNGLSGLVGYAVELAGQPKQHADFQSIGNGSTMAEVVAIDESARLYYRFFCEEGIPSEGTISVRRESQNPYFTLHYLQDGILFYFYEALDEDGNLIVTDSYYSSDYKKTDCFGREIDYHINPLDYPTK